MTKADVYVDESFAGDVDTVWYNWLCVQGSWQSSLSAKSNAIIGCNIMYRN
jgi:hypothetical protein